MSSLPVYREVWVVSDLHLGGYTGRWDETKKDWVASAETGPLGPKDRSFRIFRDAPALAKTIGDAAGVAGPVALVLNGDIVDFLADAQALGFDPEGALGKLEQIVADPEQRAVWTALQDYLKVPDHDLVLVLGNHDVELGLADVQSYLVDFLSEQDPARRSRIVHCYDGKGFRCVVGGNIVQCVHGNSADPWNDVDYATLAKVSEARRLHSRVPAFKVNPGSTLVVEHMNAVKRQYQWVDLLKPEREGAAAAVQVLDAGRSPPLLALARSVNSFAVAKSMFIGGDAPGVVEQTALRTADDVIPAADAEKWLADAQELDTKGVAPLDLAGDDGMLEAVFAARRAIGLRLGKSLRELLLEGIPNSTAWSLTDEDEVFSGQDRENDPNVDFLIAGHTHLERCLKRKRGRGFYYNSGTWILLMSIPVSALTTDSSFAPVLAALMDGSLEALEKPVPLGTGEARPLVRSLRTVVRVWEEAPGASAALFHVEADAKKGFAVNEVSGTRRALSARGVR
jgi:UDP-2,3-diacylglucosamine pyrophosphatase LpxH